MKFISKAALAAVSLLTVLPLWADNVPGTRTITQLRTYNDWAAIVYTPSYSNDLGCPGSTSNVTAVIEWRTDADKKAMYAALLGAYFDGKPIGLGISGCWSSYNGGVPLIYRVDTVNTQ